VLVFIVGLMLLWVLGPKVPVDRTIRTFDLPADLDGYLHASEARFADIVSNTEKTIIWAHPDQKQQTPVSIVYLPGFSATRQETAPLADILAQRLGANLFYTRLTGHGRGGQAMAEATVNDWLNDTVEALEIGRRIGEKVIVIGTSTGGTLATWLATYDHSDDVAAYILISPNYMPKPAAAPFLTLPWAHRILPLFFGDTWTWEPTNPLHAAYWATSHPISAVFTMMRLVQLVRQTDVNHIQCPALFILSTQDQVVRPAATEKMYARFGSPNKKKVYIENSQDPRYHVIAGDILSPNTTEPIAQIIADFVTPLLRAYP
jgi:esterase/lipase